MFIFLNLKISTNILNRKNNENNKNQIESDQIETSFNEVLTSNNKSVYDESSV